MEIRELRVAVAIAEFGSVSRAAKELHQSASSVSQALSSLEAELGVRLFSRVARGMVATDAGRAVLERARRVLHEVEGTRAAASEIEGLLSGTLSIVFTPIAVGWVADLVAAFHCEHPRVRVSLQPDLDVAIIDLVRNGEFELGITRMHDLPTDLVCSAIGAVTATVVVPEGHPLANQSSVQASDLDGVSVVMPTERFRYDFDVMCKRANVTPRVVAETDHPETMLELVRAGVGAAICSVERATTVLGRGAVLVPFVPTSSMTLATVSRQDEPLSPAADAFRALAMDRYEEVLAATFQR